MSNLLADESVHIVVLQVDAEVGHGFGIYIHDIRRHLTACELLAEHSSLLQGIDSAVGVDASFEAEGSVGAQSVSASALSDPGGMEIGALEHHAVCGLIGAAAFSSEHAGYAHGVLFVADGQVVRSQFVLHAVECDEGRAFGQRLHHDMVTFHHVGVEAVEGLSVGHHHIVGDVYDIVDGSESHRIEPVLEPFGRLLHLAAGDADAGVSLAGLLVFDGHPDGQVVIVDLEILAARTMQRRLIAVGLEPRVEVACHSPVREGVGTVGGDVHLDEPVALQVIVFSSRCAHLCVVGQYDDAGVVVTDTDFVFGTDHAARLHASEFRLLDDELFVAVVEHATQVGHDDFLSSGHVGSAANYLRWRFAAQIDGSDMQVVAVGMRFTSEHLSHIQSF